MKIVYLGTSEFAADVLRRIAGSSHRPLLVVTPPDAPRGRGRRLAAPPAALQAQELGIDVLKTEDVNAPDVRERIFGLDPEAGAVCAFGQLIREPLLSDLCLLNVHPSLLPRWRGAAPIERAILAGDEHTGVTVMRVTAGLDSGPIALSEEVEVAGRNYGELAPELAEIGARLLVRALDLLAAGDLALAEQDDARATYAEKIEPAERRLDPLREPAVTLERKVRAFTPHIGAFLELEGDTRLAVRRAAAHRADGLAAGEFAAGDGALLLGCGEGVLRIDEVQPAGKRAMAAADYLRGHPLPRLRAA